MAPILPALYAQLAAQSAIIGLIGPGAYPGAPANAVNAFFFGAASKQPPARFIVINVLDAPPAATTLSQTTALIDGEFQFDSYAESQLVARQISETIRGLLIDLVGATLPNGVTITFTENTVDRDLGYEIGAESYVFRSLLRLRAFYTETGGTLPPGPNLYQGYAAPSALHNNDDLYYNLTNGNLYEQQSSSWELVGNIPVGGGGGGSVTRYDNGDVGGLSATGNAAVWTLVVAFTANAMVFRNGELLSPGAGEDYTTSGTSITFAIAPAAGDNLVVMQ
jgi:hypothetical protein